jgi:predicted HicB family RNase H-like nuclease
MNDTMNKTLPPPGPPVGTFKVSADLHRRVKIHACQQGYKLQDFVERVLEKSLNRKKP